MSICRHKPRPAYVPRQSRRGNSPHPRQKESLRPLFADIWVSARSARLRFLHPPTAPCPVQVNLRVLQMTKCQISGQIAKCQIRRSVSAGKHEKPFPVIFLLLRQTLYDLCVPTLIFRRPIFQSVCTRFPRLARQSRLLCPRA